MREPDDWRLTTQERYLKGVVLKWRSYVPANPGNDHDHCEFCFSKFMLGGADDALIEGYATEDGYRWICKQCFDDFNDTFQWQLSGLSNIMLDTETQLKVAASPRRLCSGQRQR